MMLDNIKIVLDISLTDTSKDTKLNLLISKATQQVKTYCKVTELTPAHENVIEDLVVIRYNRRGSEGIQGETLGDRSKQFYVMGDDIPKSIKDQLDNLVQKKLKFI